jgi:hypothetical protein
MVKRLGLLAISLALSCGGDDSSTKDGGPMSDGPHEEASTHRDAGADAAGKHDSSAGEDSGTDAGPSLTSFPASSVIYQDISGAAVDSNWPTIAKVLAGGWGSNFQLDPSFTVLYADSSVPRRSFTQPASALPDCDTAPVPIPVGGNVEGQPNYFCASGDDCHLLVYQGTRLYEMYQGSITGGLATGGTFSGQCLVVWDLTHDYWQSTTPFARGDGCNGADAGDLPMSPLLLKKAEIAAHSITHAMRFTIDNSKIDDTYYVHPATHLGGGGTPMMTIPYGARLRLNSTFDVSSLATPEAQAIAVALQKYGMYMADGGGFFVSATTDITDVIDTHALASLQPTDFEMVDGGTRYDFHKETCARTPITK